MNRAAGVITLLLSLGVGASQASVTADASRQYVQIIIPNGGDTATAAGFVENFTLGGDLISEVGSASMKIAMGFQQDTTAPPPAPADTSGANVWYVNDTSLAGDVYTTAIGSDANDGLTPGTPKRTLNDIDFRLTAGDTVYVDAGWFYEKDSIIVRANSISIIGKDSSGTVIDFLEEHNKTLSETSLCAIDVSNLTIQKIRITRASRGIWLKNVDSSLISEVTIDSSRTGIQMDSGATANGVSNSVFALNSAGLELYLSNGNIVSNNRFLRNGYGVFLSVSSGNQILRNTIEDDSSASLFLYLSDDNSISENALRSSRGHGVLLKQSHRNLLDYNRLASITPRDTEAAISLAASSNNRILSTSIDSVAGWAIYLDNDPFASGQSSFDTVEKSNISLPFLVNYQDSGVYNGSKVNSQFSFKRNWWGTTDSEAIFRMIHGQSADSRSKITRIPFRLGPVDTAPGADTVAPRAPDTVAATGDSASITVTWSASSGSEEPESAVTVGGYRVYRSKTADTSYWARIADVGAGSLSYGDTAVGFGETYYYRVTTYDAKTPFENEAFYSDSIAGARAGFELASPAAFSLLTPIANAETNATTITFAWSSAVDSSPISYRLIVDTDLAGNFVIDTVTTLLGATHASPLRADSYLWRVIATDTWGNSRTVGDSTFLIETTPPSAATPTAPAGGLETGATTLTFSWSAASDSQSGVNRYRIQIDTAGTFANLVVDTVTTGATLASPLPGNGTYVWRVIAHDDAGNTSTSTTGTFVINTNLPETTPPAAFTLVTPADGFETNLVLLTFSWNASSDSSLPISYRLIVDTDLAGAFVIDTTTTLLGATLASPLRADSYLWRVIASDARGNTTATATRGFIVDTLATVTLTSPDSGTSRDSRPIFSWNGISAETYRIEISPSSAFSTIAESSTTTATTYQSTGRDSGGYHWRVVAFDRSGNLDTAAGRAIRIDTGLSDTTPPAAFSLAIGHFDTSATSFTLAWNTATDSGLGLSYYRIQIATSSTFANLLVDSTSTGATLASPLQGNGTFYWRVIAVDAAGNTTVAGPSSFTIDTARPSVPALLSPIGGTETTVTSIRFDWSDATDTGAGIAAYRLDVASDSAFQSILLKARHLGASETTPTYIFTTIASYYWRVIAIDAAGNAETSAADSFARPAPADQTPPSAVGGLSAVANTDATITICWAKSPASDMTGGGQYNIYWDNATGAISETAVPYANVLHNATDTRYCFTTPALTSGSLYSFIVRAQDRSGNENRDSTKVSVYSQAGAPPVPHAVITQPKSGNRVLREVALIAAEIEPDTQIDLIGAVIFQYRADTTNLSASWETMLTVTASHPNPSEDSAGRRFKIQWDIQGVRTGNAPVPSGVYNLRAVAVSRTGQRDSTPAIVTLNVVDNNPDRSDTKTTDGKQKSEERVHQGRENSVVVADTKTSMDLVLPEGALSGESTTVVVTIDPAPTVAPPGRQGIGGSVDIDLSSGQKNLSGGKKATVKISYSDTNNDGVVDGTTLNAKDIEMWTLSSGTWEKGENQVLDTAASTVKAEFSHFSTFILTVGGAASGNLNAYSVFPNPWKPNDGDANTGREFDGTANSGITFINLPDQVQLKIFTVRGAKVIDFATHASGGTIQWDVRSDDKKPVASGWYFYSITDLVTGQTVMGKLAVVR